MAYINDMWVTTDLPVRPIRWTYSSMSLGRSKFTTCLTLLMSRPRAATWREEVKVVNKRSGGNSYVWRSANNHFNTRSQKKLNQCREKQFNSHDMHGYCVKRSLLHVVVHTVNTSLSKRIWDIAKQLFLVFAFFFQPLQSNVPLDRFWKWPTEQTAKQGFESGHLLL